MHIAGTARLGWPALLTERRAPLPVGALAAVGGAPPSHTYASPKIDVVFLPTTWRVTVGGPGRPTLPPGQPVDTRFDTTGRPLQRSIGGGVLVWRQAAITVVGSSASPTPRRLRWSQLASVSASRSGPPADPAQPAAGGVSISARQGRWASRWKAVGPSERSDGGA